MRIFKYILSIDEKQIVKLPSNSKILDIQFQDNNLCLWAMVIVGNPDESRVIRIFGTGSDVIGFTRLNYISTVQKNGLVWHIFEEL